MLKRTHVQMHLFNKNVTLLYIKRTPSFEAIKAETSSITCSVHVYPSECLMIVLRTMMIAYFEDVVDVDGDDDEDE